MAERATDMTNWTDMFGGLYDRLTGSNAQIIYAFDKLEIDVPIRYTFHGCWWLMSLERRF